jgi:predicted RNA binding protein YcfA (HicA-like mRNA interferase family)
MSQKIIPENVRKIIQRLQKLGFEEVRTAGSHRQFKDSLGHLVTVADHPGDIWIDDIRSIIRQTGLKREDFYTKSN